MRDPARIEPTLDAIREIWIKHPDMRLGQLLWVSMSGRSGPDLFSIEDEPLVARLQELAQRLNSQRAPAPMA